MKIVCDACQAKYSISDDKVQGKVFKIRCKKCSNIIVVRGGAGAAGAAEAPAPTPVADTRVYDYGYDGGGADAAAGDESVWHVVINQDQVGPMTAAEVQQRFAAGDIDGETYAWREGFADWLPLSQIDAFAAYVASGSTTAATSSSGSGAAAVSAMFGGGGNDESGTVRSDPGDLFAAASSGSSANDDDGGDLFGSKPSKAASGGGGSSSADKLRGERNENSVLFSLNNLAQLASDKPAPNAGVSSMPSGHATGAAGGEGSGLIDIRSMANAYLGGGAGQAKPASASAGIGSMDDLPVFGGGGFSEPAVIVPTSQRQSNSKMMYALIGSVGVLAIAAVILVVVLLKGDKSAPVVAAGATKDEPAKVAENDKGSSDEKPVPTGEAKTGSDAPVGEPAKAGSDAPPTTEPVKESTEPKTEPKATDKADKKETKKDKPKSGAVAKTEPKEIKTAPTPTPPKADPGAGGGCDEVSCVLNNYEGSCCAKFKKGGAKTAPKAAAGGGDLPDSLDRAMISDGVNKVKAKVMACGDKSSAKGQVKVSVKVNPAGDVASVSVKNTPDASLGSCVGAAMQKAKFAKTASGGSFGYPFVF